MTAPGATSLRWHGSANGRAAEIVDAFAPLTDDYVIALGSPADVEAVQLDTPDWRLMKAGCELSYLPRSRTLSLTAPTGESIDEQFGTALQWPRLAAELPDGPIRDLVADAAWIRALVVVARTTTTSRVVTVRNADQKIVARIVWKQVRVLEPATDNDGMLPVRLEIRPLRGYEREADDIRQLLAEQGAFSAAQQPSYEDLKAATGLGPVAPPAPIRRRERADAAIARVFLGFLDDIEASLGGAIGDIDVEFLHDLRVDVRRTRSLLKRLGDVLPAGTVDAFADEFKWLGAITTPTRDLDVYLMGVADLKRLVCEPDDLEPFVDHLRAQRATERRAMVRGLRSARLERLLTSWRAALDEVVARGGKHPLAVGQLAGERLQVVYLSVAKRARRLSDASPAEDVHNLRKAAKDLRYLLEVFQPVCEPLAHKRVVSDLKRLQDVLGEFQDGEVQAAGVRTYAQQMIDAGETRASVLLAMGELSGQFSAKQQRARRELDAHHDSYLGEPDRPPAGEPGAQMKIVASYNVKGGVGKTSAAVNLAYLAAREGRRTLLWDLDPQAAATFMFRIRPKVKGGSEDLVRGRLPIDHAVKATDFDNLDVLPADFTYRNMDLDLVHRPRPTRTMQRLLAPLAKDYDLVVLDTPPSLSLVSENVLHAADVVVVPIIPDRAVDPHVRPAHQLRRRVRRSATEAARLLLDGRPPPQTSPRLRRHAADRTKEHEHHRDSGGCRRRADGGAAVTGGRVRAAHGGRPGVHAVLGRGLRPARELTRGRN